MSELIDTTIRYYEDDEYDKKFKTLLEAMYDGTIGGGGNTPVAWSRVEGTPTTLAGYGIADAAKLSDANQNIVAKTFTGAFSGNASTATKLTTPRAIKMAGITAAAQNFDGSADVTLTVTNVPANLISGVLSIDNIPAVAQEILKTVANDTERFALTISDVQNGDTVLVLSPAPGVMYRVVDDTKLDSADGYIEYSAGMASKALADSAGNNIVNTYAKKTEVATTYATKAELTTTVAPAANKLSTARKINNVNFDGTADITVADATKLPLTGGTLTGNVTAPQFVGALVGNASTATKLAATKTIGLSGVTATAQAFDGSANITIPITAVPYSIITGTPTDLVHTADLSTYATTDALTSGLNGKANTSHTHTTSQITNFPDLTTYAVKTEVATTYATKTELTDGLAAKANTSSLSVYALKTEIPTSLPANGGNSATATKLATPRTISLSGITATGASFDGSANVTIAVTAVPYSIVTGKPTIPTKTSELTNDSNFATTADIPTKMYEAGTTEPTNTNLLWIDTTATPALKYYNGTAWTALA